MTSLVPNRPVSVAPVGAMPLPMRIGVPSYDRPSADSAKYDDPNAVDVPSLKVTTSASCVSETSVTTGQRSSPDEFAPVWSTMSNSPLTPGSVTSHAM